MKKIITATALFCCHFAVYAEEQAVASSTAAALKSPTAMMLQTLIGLGIVVASIYGLAWLSKRLNIAATGGDKKMDIIAVQPLGPKEKAVLMTVAGRQILIGVAPGRVSTLHVFEDETEAGSDEAVDLKPQIRTAPASRVTALAARSTSEFSKKLQLFLNPGNR